MHRFTRRLSAALVDRDGVPGRLAQARMSRRAMLRAGVAATCVLAGASGRAMDKAAASPSDLKLVAFGDSLTAGYGLPAAAAFPSVLEAALRERGRSVTIANAGVSGDTASGGLERVDWSVPDGTRGVILELGANDMLRGVDPAVTAKALTAILDKLRERKIPVLLAGMRAAPNLGEDYVRRFEAIYTDLAQRYGLVLYPFFLDGVAGDRTLALPDGVHPTAAGVKIIVERILPSVELFLDRIGATPS